MLITLSPTSTTTLGRYPFHYMYVFVCVVVFMSFHQPFHRINDARKPGTVSSKQELFPKKKKKKKKQEKFLKKKKKKKKNKKNF